MSALVICTGGGIGDVLLATPVMRALKARFGDVVALTTVAHRDVLANDPDLAEIWTDDVPFWRQVRRIRARGFDAAVVTWASQRAALLPFAARVPLRAGQSRRSYSFAFTHRVAVKSEFGDRTTHWTQILLDFARALGCDVADATPVFAIAPGAAESIAATLQQADVSGPYIVLHPTRGIAAMRERWPTHRLRELASALAAAYSARVVVTGALGDRAVAETIARGTGAVSLAGRTSLAEYGALARGALAVVAMDSGPMHVAAAVGAPTAGIFALRSDEPDRWAPLGPQVAVVRGSYPCPPAHRKETCPNFACIEALEIPHILAAVSGLLGRGNET